MPIAIIALVVLAGAGFLLLERSSSGNSAAGAGANRAAGNVTVTVPDRQVTAGPTPALPIPAGLRSATPSSLQSSAQLADAAAKLFPALVTSVATGVNDASRIANQNSAAVGKVRPNDLATGSQAKTDNVNFKALAGEEDQTNVFGASSGLVTSEQEQENLAATYYAIDQGRIAQGLAPIYSSQNTDPNAPGFAPQGQPPAVQTPAGWGPGGY